MYLISTRNILNKYVLSLENIYVTYYSIDIYQWLYVPTKICIKSAPYLNKTSADWALDLLMMLNKFF